MLNPPYHALARTRLPDGAGGPFPARRLSGREGSQAAVQVGRRYFGKPITPKPGVEASCGKPPLPEFLKHTPQLRLRRHAHGSIRVQEGQPARRLNPAEIRRQGGRFLAISLTYDVMTGRAITVYCFISSATTGGTNALRSAVPSAVAAIRVL